MKYYVQMFSVHGLIRFNNLELGFDSDTGGQINYVVELAKELSQRSDIRRIDLFTRLVSDKSVSEDYARPIEIISDKLRIIRIQCGGRKYIRKELLWPHLDEYVDKTIKFIKTENAIPDIVHGHYADAGYIAMQLAEIFGIPFVFTGHSLGRPKKLKLLSDGLKEHDINKKLKIDYRIQVEEDVLKRADLIIASTHQEIKEQYGVYRDNKMAQYYVIPPGLNVDKFYPFYYDMMSENEKDELALYAKASVIQELDRFFMHPDKPLILALCRPDKRKNISGLVKAFGEDLELQAVSNLAIFAGIRKDISTMEENERDVLTRILLMMDKYDLYGKMAIPKKHDFEHEVPELYRIAASKKGVFVNPALTEPFGLTLLEASATGLPVIATDDGGPKDIIRNCNNGILVNALDSKEIAEGIKSILLSRTLWKKYSKNGIINIRKHYTWDSHATTYLDQIKKLVNNSAVTDMRFAKPSDSIGRRIANLNYFLISDIDYTLIGKTNKGLKKLIALLSRNRDRIGFGVATGRSLKSTLEILEKHAVPAPDIIISSVGTEIYYGPALHYGHGWETHISNKWNRDKIVQLMEAFSFVDYQEEATQSRFKISYFMAPGKDRLAKIHYLLLKHKCRYNLIYSNGKYLDIIPYRASKGKAIRYLCYKWNIPLGNFMVCGDSGNDEEMLKGEPLAAVVGNYSEELEVLKGGRNVYFAKRSEASGILEALEYYRFIEKAKGEKTHSPLSR